MHVSLPSQSQITTEAEVVEVQWLAKQVYRLMVTADISYIPGQYMTLWKDDQIGRSYSIASLPNKDNLIEFHIKHITNGAFSDWAHQLKPGQKIRIQGPIGECCYANDAPEAPMILIGTGTGLAPLYGILQDAISHGHQGKIYLFTGAFNTDTLYYIDELKKLETEWPQLDLQLCVLKDSDDRPDIVALDALDKVVLASDLPLKTAHIYLCGAPDIIEVLRKQLFLKGASFQRIHADIFVPSNP